VRLHLFATTLILIVAASNVQGQQSIADEALNKFSLINIGGHFSSHTVRHWKSMRDDGITKQDKDFSCGAAALATLLNGFYGQSLTEESILKALDKGDKSASFEDMAKAMSQFGFRATGYATNYEQLSQLKRPVVVYLKHEKNDHFSVIRGIDKDSVWLADSSLGNRRYTKSQFLEMWDTRDDQILKGKFLAIFPNNSTTIKTADTFFTNHVVMVNKLSEITLKMVIR
jgi:uncharacterized protein